jgi:hypothetical protein
VKQRLFGYLLAGGMVLGMTARASAQAADPVRMPNAGAAFTISNLSGATLNGYYMNGLGNPYYNPVPAPVFGPSYGGGYAPLISPASSWFNASYAPAGPIRSANWPYIAPGPSWYSNYSYAGFGYGGYGICP